MVTEARERKITWYRSPVEREEMTRLLQRSDWRGLVQSLGHLGLLVLMGAATWAAVGRLPFWVVLIILYVHGALWAFLLNGFHELCHRTVFKSKTLNLVFLQIVSFLGCLNPVLFWASHQEHHKYTLYPPDDLEVVLPVKLTVQWFIKAALVNPWDLVGRYKGIIRLSMGRLEGEWENHLFPESKPELRRDLFTWARIQLIGQILIVAVSLYFGQWIIPVIITLAPFYGGGLQVLCNNTQHVGLQDNTPDYRLNCRTILLNPFLQFIYWHMNFHTEHHMYAAVPCYNLGKLHELIKDDLPHCPKGLAEAWREIIPILERQKVDPTYEFVPQLPAR